MRKAGKVFLWLAAILVGAIVLYEVIYPTVTYRYRMTVDVEVDGQIHSGSSVIEVTIISQPSILPDMGGAREKVSGQAVFVDLGGARNMITLLSSGFPIQSTRYPARIVPLHYDLTYKWGDLVQFPFLDGEWQIDLRTAPLGDRPTLVTFEDLRDPKTAKIVEPTNFQRVFGSGVGLPTVTIEMTNDRVTCGLYDKLPWLKTFSGVTGGTLRVHAKDLSEPGKFLTRRVFVQGSCR